MKVKKIVLGMVIATAMLIVTGCGTNAKTAFIKNLSDKDLFDTQEMSLKIKDLKFEGGTDMAYLNMIANQVKDLSIESSTSKDPKNNLTKTNVTLKTLGMSVPFEVITESKSVYISTGFMTDLLKLAGSFSYGTLPFDKDHLAQLEGKYVDISEYANSDSNEKKADGKNKKDSEAAPFSGEKYNPFKAMSDLPTNKLSAELKKTLEGFDKDSFKKDGDVLTHTFTNDEFIKILETYDKVLKEDKKTKKDYTGSEEAKALKDAIQTLKDKTVQLEVKMSLNKKAQTIDTEIRVDAHQEDQTMKLVVTTNSKAEKKETTIERPNKKDILTPKEFEKIMTNIGAGGITRADDDEIDDETMEDILGSSVDEYLDEVIDQINNTKGGLSEKEAKELREELSDYLNKEQMDRLNDAIDKASQKAA